MNLPDLVRTLAAVLLRMANGGHIRRGQPGVRITITPLDNQMDRPWEHTYSVDFPAADLDRLITALYGPGWTPVPPPRGATGHH